MAKKFLVLLLTTLFASLMVITSFAEVSNPLPPVPVLIPDPPSVNAKAYVLMDANSGAIIASSNMDQKLPPASLTKMMTLFLASQALQNGSIKLDTPVSISKKAWQKGGSKMFVRVNTEVPVDQLLQGIIVDSGNDACVAMSEFIAGSEDTFVSMMNQQAKMLGMNNTHYTDCTGMPHPEHYSTAYDLATLARALINNFPDYYHYYKQKWFVYNGIRQPNRNRLLWRYPDADGIKTGHTDEAGFCLTASAEKNGMRLIVVVLGAPTDEARADDSIRLLNYGFRFFNSHLIYQAGATIEKPRVWFGSEKYVPLGVTHDLYATTPVGQYHQVNINTAIDSGIQAPVQKGQALGQISVTLNDKVIGTASLVALENIDKGGIWRRSVDHIAHLFHGWFGSGETKKSTTMSPQNQTNDTNGTTISPTKG